MTNVMTMTEIADAVRRAAADEIGFMRRYFSGVYEAGRSDSIIRRFTFNSPVGVLNVNIFVERRKPVQDIPARLTLHIAGHSYRGWFLGVEQQLLRHDDESLQRYAAELADAAIEQIDAYMAARAAKPKPSRWQRFWAALSGDDALMPQHTTA